MKSRVIYEGRNYTACAMRDGSLIVTSNITQRGKRLTEGNAAHWIDAIGNAIDKAEAHALCRGIMQA